MAQAGVILGEQSRRLSAHSNIIVINELHNSGNIIEECGDGIIGQIFDSLAIFRDRRHLSQSTITS